MNNKSVTTNDIKGRFVAGQSGNPAGRPKGSKNQMTLLRQSLEYSLREKSGSVMHEVLQQAMNLALEGDRTMIKLLLELHMTKSVADEREATDKVSITIGTTPQSQPQSVIINGDKYETESNADTLLPDGDIGEGN